MERGQTVVTQRDGKTLVRIKLYTLSIAASRREGDNLRVEHAASSAQVDNERAALEQGRREAQETWPLLQGWQHDVKAKPLDLDFEFGD